LPKIKKFFLLSKALGKKGFSLHVPQKGAPITTGVHFKSLGKTSTTALEAILHIHSS
jgi:hypothetical protein